MTRTSDGQWVPTTLTEREDAYEQDLADKYQAEITRMNELGQRLFDHCGLWVIGEDRDDE